MVRSPAAVRRTTGRTCVKSTKSSGSIAASGVAASWRTRNRIAPVAASPASIQPLNAVTIVGIFDGGLTVKCDLVHDHPPRRQEPHACDLGDRGRHPGG